MTIGEAGEAALAAKLRLPGDLSRDSVKLVPLCRLCGIQAQAVPGGGAVDTRIHPCFPRWIPEFIARDACRAAVDPRIHRRARRKMRTTLTSHDHELPDSLSSTATRTNRAPATRPEPPTK